MITNISCKSVSEILWKFLTIESGKIEEKNEMFLQMKIKAMNNFVNNFENLSYEELLNLSVII